jgi:hypothetical protein
MHDEDDLGPVEAERRRRMAAVWRSSPPPEHAPARLRHGRARAAVVRPLTTGTVLAFLGYAAIGAAALGGAASVVTDWARPQSAPERVPSAPPSREVSAPRGGAARLNPQPGVPEVEPSPVSDESPQRAPASVAASARPSRPAAVREIALPAAPPPLAREAHSVGAFPVPAEVDGEPGAWTRAEAALARGDRAEADRALAELSTHEQPAVRDAAALSRAQLWMAAGQAERARPVLERLSARGATAIVRKRAADLLGKMGR